ncbi:MAG TPA: AAA family ATPase [Pyrinomonadaceae bacterium]|nr:AAA family ATPase [Pyrinomonadaceae bacterium]
MSIPLAVARAYMQRGWMPLPIAHQSKKPNRAGWQRFSTTQGDLPQFFNGQPQNIGVLLGKPSGGLTDVDLDCPESIALASYFLPSSNAVFGRTSRPHSHYLYITTDDAKTVKFEDTDGKMLLELRYTGCQTIFPGSTHPSGEKVEWHMDGEPSRVSYAGLLRAVRRMAAACLIVRHYPTQGSRNDLSLALAGGLLRAGWTEQETEHFINAVCTAAQDEETQARAQNVIGTAKKLASGEHITGWPTLAKLMTDAAVERIRLWLELRDANPATQASTTAKGTETTNDDTPLRVVCMADVEPEQVSWLWHPYIAKGKLTLLEGDPGLGKSWLTCAIACAVSHGKGLPNAAPFEAGNVLMLSAEDGLGDTLRPRLDAVGADVRRIFALDEPLTLDASGLIRLEAAIIERAPTLVIIDPLFAFTGGKVDIHRANECRAISAPLAAIAERHGCAMVAVRHLGKSRGGGHALNAGIGSIDFTAAARSVLLVGRDPDDEQKRAIVQTKNNLAAHGEAIGYKLEGSQFFWMGVSDLTAERILAASSDEGERSTITEAVDYLRTALSSGARDSKAIQEEARQAGISEATLRRAKARLKVQPRKVGMPGSHFQKWVWELPNNEGAQQGYEDAQTSENDHLRANGTDKGSYSTHLAEDDQGSEFEHLRERPCTSSGEDVQPLTDEEAEFAARLEYNEHLPRAEAERRAREWFAPVPF